MSQRPRRVLGLLSILLCAVPLAHAEEVVRIATLAPTGSPWMNFFNDWARLAAQRSGNQLRLRFYPGGTMGDERDYIRKIRIHQIDGAAVTTVGLGIIYRPVLVFGTDGLFETYEEMDHARSTLRPEMERGFEQAGFVLTGWGDTGMNRIFSNSPVRTVADLRHTRSWIWTDDPTMDSLFSSANMSGVHIGLPEVYPALQTRMIDSIITSPLAALQLQWYTRVHYMTNLNVSVGIGATVISKERFDRLPAALQQVLRQTGNEIHERLIPRIRSDDDGALAELRRRGLTVVEVPADARTEWVNLENQARHRLVGSVYSRELLDRVEHMVAEMRGSPRR